MMKKLFLFFAVSTLMLAMACNSGGFGSNGPKKVLVKFIHALEKKDIEEAKKYVTKDSEPLMNMIKMGMNMSGETGNEDDLLFKGEEPVIGKAEIEGDKATVPVSNKAGDQTSNFILKKENGDWKVAFDKATIMEMSGEKMKEHGMQDDKFDQEDMKKALDSFKNLSKEDMEKATQAMDSLKEVFKELNKDGKMDKMMEDAGKMMEQIQKKSQ